MIFWLLVGPGPPMPEKRKAAGSVDEAVFRKRGRGDILWGLQQRAVTMEMEDFQASCFVSL